MFIYGLYYKCKDCDKEYYQKTLDVPTQCWYCRSPDVRVTKLIRFHDTPGVPELADEILVLENRISYAIMELEKQMSYLRGRFKTFLTDKASSKVKTS